MNFDPATKKVSHSMGEENGEISNFTRPLSLPAEEGSVIFCSPEVTCFRTRSCRSLPVNKRPNLVTKVQLHPSENLPPLASASFSTNFKEEQKKSSSFCCLLCCWKRSSSPSQSPKHTRKRTSLSRNSFSSKTFLKRHNNSLASLTNVSQTLSLSGEEGKREWGEERDNDVIYAITLKRVNKLISSNSNPSDGLQWETQKVRYIKGATLTHLVEHLCRCFMEDCEERNFLTVFLATYRSFSSAEEVLNLIIKERENLKQESLERKRLILSSTMRVLRTWLERFFEEDFFDPPRYPLLKHLQEFVEDCRKNDGINVADFLTYIKTKMKIAEKKRKSRLLNENSEFINPRFSNYIPLPRNSFSVPNDANGELVNVEAVKIFLNVLTPRKVAEQLTVIDANFFLNVVPHHCLYAVRSSKGKPATVKATIDQFNRVVYSVLATCLHPMLKLSHRVKICCKWIEIAQVCRELKNFSSLRAVISGLQAHPVHRLRRTWQNVPHSLNHLLKELEQINTKDSILKVGTAKVNTERSSIHQVRKDASMRRQQDIHSGIMHGTVPYLGSFLSDLTYLHTAKPDFIEKGIINFEKRRKEFELLAQLRLWQVSCRSYHHFKSDLQFSTWFSSVALPSDEQANKLSEEIEPPVTASPLSPNAPSKKTDCVFAHQQQWLSSGCSSTSLPPSQARASDLSPHGKQNGHVTSHTTEVDGERIVQVQIIKKTSDLNHKINEKAKELKLSSNDRSPAFVRKAFNLFDLNEEDVNKFQVMQILPGDKELTIPDNGNVFYAMNSSTDEYNFMLVEKGASVPREKSESQIQQTSPVLKSKKSSRKILQSSSPSPMKTIYKHLGISGFSWANSGCYSPSKVANKNEQLHDSKDQIMPRNKSSKTTGKKKSLKLDKSMNPDQHLNLFSGLVEIYKPLGDACLSSDVPCNSNVEQRSSSTWPRSQTFSVHDMGDDEPKLQRRAAIRKHHSHPRETTGNLSLLPPVKLTSGRKHTDNSSLSSAEFLSTDASDDVASSTTSPLRGSRSEVFVTYLEHQNLQRHVSADLLENGTDKKTEYNEAELRRSASDPCLLESIESVNDVFGEPELHFEAHVTSPRPRRSSKTTTTYL